MSKLLQEIILNFQEADPNPGVPRRIRVTPVPGKATVCIGVRRSGKSTFLFQRMRRLREAGVPRENFLYLNLPRKGAGRDRTVGEVQDTGMDRGLTWKH